MNPVSHLRVLLLAVAVMPGLGCSPPLSHRDAAKLVDPDLRIDGRVLDSEGTGRQYRLGPYRVQTLESETQSVAPPASTPTAAPADRIRVRTKLSGVDGRPAWVADCEAIRSRTGSADYGAVLDESQDAIDLRCDLRSDDGAAWRFETQGVLSNNLSGKLVPRAESIAGDHLGVEILLWRKRFDAVRRHLPEPVMQVKLGRSAIAALVASREPQAWVATDAPPAFIEVALATMTAIGQMPIGLAG